MYTEASATQQSLFDETSINRRVSTDFFPALYYRSTLNDHFVFVTGVWYYFVVGSANFH